MNHTRKPATPDSDLLAQDLRALVDDAQAVVKHAVRDAGSGYDDARARLEERLADSRSRLAAFEQAAVDGIKRAGRSADSYLSQNPWPAIGASAGVGLVLGLLIGRR